MINNNHKNSGCGNAEKLVSYLYSENGAAENTTFEAHLQACSVCSDELQAFSGVQFSINDWKLKEFAQMETPIIQIPYEKVIAPSNDQEVSGVTALWLSGLRKYFSLSPAWSLATASFAVLAVCAVIALIVLNSDKSNDVAGTNKNTKPVAVPTVEKTTAPTNENSNQNSLPETDVKPLNEQKALPEIAVAPDTKDSLVVKTTNRNQRQTQKAETTNLPKNNNIVKRDNQNKITIPPKMIEEAEEDDTLRLAELFEEIDTVE